MVHASTSGDERAREQLIEAFQPLIASVARTYRGSRAVDRGELMQEGALGLLRAAERYDPVVGTPFWAYASWWVRQAMQQLVAEMTRPVVLSDRALRKLARIKDARSALIRDHEQDPTVSEIAAESGFTREQVESLLATDRAPRGLDEPLQSEHGGVTLGDLLADPAAEDEYEAVADSAQVGELRHHCDGLDDRERHIVQSHYGLIGPAKTLREIGEGLDLSVERVRQLEERALGRLRDALEASGRAPAERPVA